MAGEATPFNPVQACTVLPGSGLYRYPLAFTLDLTIIHSFIHSFIHF